LTCTNYAGHLDLSTLAQIKLNIPYCHRVVIISCSNIPINPSCHQASTHATVVANVLHAAWSHSIYNWIQLYTASQKNKQNYFCYNYVKLPPNL